MVYRIERGKKFTATTNFKYFIKKKMFELKKFKFELSKASILKTNLN